MDNLHQVRSLTGACGSAADSDDPLSGPVNNGFVLHITMALVTTQLTILV
jgi:hypothetical protein